MAHVELGLALFGVALLTGCWEDRGSCELWAGKLERGEESAVAVRQLAEGRCVGARAQLVSHLRDANLGTDVLAALVALGRSPEAETAVRDALGRAETAAVAARQVVAWELAGAEQQVRAALADQGLALHHQALLDAALAIAPASRWIPTLARELGDDGPTAERSLAALATVDWSEVPDPERATAALAFAELAGRDGVSAERAASALHLLGRLPAVSLGDAAPIARRAAAGSRNSLLALWCVRDPSLLEVARGLVHRERLAPDVRALALAIAARDGDPARLVADAPAEDELAVGLALAAGAAAVPALEARMEGDKGAARAAFARALGFALPVERLEPWEESLRKSPSLLLRAIPDEPSLARILALARRCGAEVSCLASAIDEALARLSELDGELGSARAALDDARAKAETAIAKDAARAQELALATADLAAARRELEAIAARRDAIYAGVGRASRRVAELAAEPLAITWALRRLPPSGADRAARALLESCRGAACAELRAWAAVAAGDPALACRLEPTEPK